VVVISGGETEEGLIPPLPLRTRNPSDRINKPMTHRPYTLRRVRRSTRGDDTPRLSEEELLEAT
jgi:hypothetical protein